MNSFGDFIAPCKMRNFGIRLLGVGTIGAGVLDLLWRDFDSGHQPINDLGFAVPGRGAFACIVGVLMILAGAALIRRRTMRMGAWGIAIIYGVVGLFSLPLFHSLIHQYGFHLTLVLGVLGRMLQQYIVVAACAILMVVANDSSQSRDRVLRATRWVFGLSGILFGLAHLVNPHGVMRMIPGWFPLQPYFWVALSGIAFLLAGTAIVSGVLGTLAARLLALMLLIFEVILVPIIFQYPRVHQAWGATAYNLAVAGSVLIFASALSNRASFEVNQAEPSLTGSECATESYK